MFPQLDPLLHARLRLGIMSILIGSEEADFVYLQEKTGATSGNLSVQIEKLREAGYLEVAKSFKGKIPRTTCRITSKGINAFEQYVQCLRDYLPSK